MSGAVSETIAQEGNLLLISLLCGMLFMLGYDMLRILRRIIPHGAIGMAIEDAAYWIACAVGIFAMLYQENDGLLRWFVLAGIALGMLIENGWISPWVIGICVKIIKVVMGVLGKIWKIVTIPGKKVFIIFRKQLKKIKKAIKIGLCKL